MFAFLKYFVFLTFVIEEFYFNISFPQRYQHMISESWENEKLKMVTSFSRIKIER